MTDPLVCLPSSTLATSLYLAQPRNTGLLLFTSETPSSKWWTLSKNRFKQKRWHNFNAILGTINS